VRWLQLVPFRVPSDEDMLAVAMINLALERNRLRELKLDPEVSEYWRNRDHRMEDLAGYSAQRKVIGISYFYHSKEEDRKPTAAWIAKAREHYQTLPIEGRDPFAEKSITTTLDDVQKSELSAYIASASSLADAVMIEKISQHQGQYYYPNPLSVAAWLGSSYAEELEKADAKTKAIRVQHSVEFKDEKRYDDLHSASLRVLQRLLEPLPPDAPAFMKNRAWQAKTCQTVLSGWAQTRHVWALQAKAQYSVGAGVEGWPAFIEPMPDFFSGLAGLCHKAKGSFARARWDYDPSRLVARRLRRMADEYENPPMKNGEAYEQRLTILEFLLESGVPNSDEDLGEAKEIARFAQIMRQSADQIEKGEAEIRDPIARKLKERLSTKRAAPFDDLEETCLRLASLAHKQMRGLSPRAEEHEWLQYFGVVLAEFTDCHFSAPRDNVPIAARVFTNPSLEKALTVGIGRPTFLYVLYPWKGKDILCRGAVLPYLERHDWKTFTDAEWQTTLHHPESPAIQPDWLKPLLSD
jgi:hypothetical protein